jgi:hypothetical protein
MASKTACFGSGHAPSWALSALMKNSRERSRDIKHLRRGLVKVDDEKLPESSKTYRFGFRLKATNFVDNHAIFDTYP